MNEELIAPCGINCAVCYAYLRDKKHCPGCRDLETNCAKKNCETIRTNSSGLCFECNTFPCQRLKQLDKRYSSRYNMSLIENLEYIRDNGMAAFLEKEEKKWKCPECGGVISCHAGFCHHCALEKRKSRKKEKGAEQEEAVLIAPCGMNCGICGSYLAMKYDLQSQGLRMGYCAGCRPRDKQCAFIMKSCRLLFSGDVDYCYECDEFPCRNLQHIDERYRERYRMSMIENMEYIRDNGMAAFLKKEEEKWKCPECGGVICCHNGICYSCGIEKLRNKENIHRWDNE